MGILRGDDRAGKALLSRGRFINQQADEMGSAEFKAARLAMGLTQEELAGLLDLAPMQVGRYEREVAPVPRGVAVHVLLLAGRLRV